jgi:hypothetical protein
LPGSKLASGKGTVDTISRASVLESVTGRFFNRTEFVVKLALFFPDARRQHQHNRSGECRRLAQLSHCIVQVQKQEHSATSTLTVRADSFARCVPVGLLRNWFIKLAKQFTGVGLLSEIDNHCSIPNGVKTLLLCRERLDDCFHEKAESLFDQCSTT